MPCPERGRPAAFQVTARVTTAVGPQSVIPLITNCPRLLSLEPTPAPLSKFYAAPDTIWDPGVRLRVKARIGPALRIGAMGPDGAIS